MNRLCFIAGFCSAVALSCGGGGTAGLGGPAALAPILPPPVFAAPALAPIPAFAELWASLEVRGVVTTGELKQTPDGSDPQQPWAANAISGIWGTLRTLDGSVPGLPDVTGRGPNASWALSAGRLAFHAAPATAPTGQSTGGFALISRQTFPRAGRIAVEAAVDLTQGTLGAFAGLALISGEGDYRELAIYRRAGGDTVDRVAPLFGDALAPRAPGPVVLRIEYDPAGGFRYLADGVLLMTEPLEHRGASFAADPSVGLYFTADSTVPGAVAEGSVGPVRVWQ